MHIQRLERAKNTYQDVGSLQISVNNWWVAGMQEPETTSDVSHDWKENLSIKYHSVVML